MSRIHKELKKTDKNNNANKTWAIDLNRELSKKRHRWQINILKSFNIISIKEMKIKTT